MANHKAILVQDLPHVEKLVESQPVVADSQSTFNEPIYVDWDGPADKANPMNWSKSRKWFISGLALAFLFLASASLSAYTIAQPSLQDALNLSQVTGTLGSVVFNISYGVAPLFLAPSSELFGRVPVYIASALTFWLMYLPQALAKNYAAILVVRFISGIGASTAVAIASGTLADIWETHERGLPMAIFSFVAWAGTGLGAVSFGYVGLTLGYRYVNWIMFGLCGMVTIAIVVSSKETRASVLLIRKAARYRTETGDLKYRAKAEEERVSAKVMIKVSLTRPIRLLFTEPVLLAYAVWITFAFGLLYLMLESLPLTFTELYNFNAGENGLVFLCQVIGGVFGMALNVWCERLYTRHVSKKGPEARLYIAMISGLALPIGFWTYTWTGWRNVHWIVPMAGLTLIYTSTFGIYLACFNYVADSYTVYASSALSGVSCIRLAAGGTFGLFADAMYQNLGIHNAGTILAALSTAFAITPFVLYRYGAAIRARSPVAKRLASSATLT